MRIEELGRRVGAARDAAAARGETFYPGPSRIHLAAFPPKERWDDWVELDTHAWPRRVEKRYMLVPTTCFNCESACGLLAYVDRETMQVRKFEGNPEHPGSRGRNCAKGPATLNQVTDPDRILFPLKRAASRGAGAWARVSWDEALDDIASRIRRAIQEGRHNEVMYHVGRPGEDGFTERVLAAWGVDGHNTHTNICSSGGRTGSRVGGSSATWGAATSASRTRRRTASMSSRSRTNLTSRFVGWTFTSNPSGATSMCRTPTGKRVRGR
jgi:anaerobic selenocysteine-containing dehydrogenase